MSDASVQAALRSDTRLVVIEAPAGCGKTYQGAELVVHAASKIGDGRILVLAHTHAAVDVFASRARGLGSRLDVRTIDSLIAEIASAYHSSLGLPPDPGVWVRGRSDGYQQLARLVARLVRASPMIAQALHRRYPLIVCDEHQDSSSDQHALVIALHQAGSAIRVFGDPMQYIFGGQNQREIEADLARWDGLKANGTFEELDHPHRWSGGSEQLGDWILRCRHSLKEGGSIDLRQALPPQLRVVFADNTAARHGMYQTAREEGREIRRILNRDEQLLVLARHNDTVTALRAYSGRQLPVWEGHTRGALDAFVAQLYAANDDPCAVAKGVVGFVADVGVGFSPSAFGNRFEQEVADRCSGKARGLPATLQGLAQMIVDEPNHRGASKVLARIRQLSREDAAFDAVKIDHAREYMEAVGLGGFDDLLTGFGELSLRRTNARPPLPTKSISTVHKAKGLEADNVVLMPCDRVHFADNRASRCALYVAMSRARRSLTLVVSKGNRTPLISL